MSGLDGAREFAEACLIAYPDGSEQKAFCILFVELMGGRVLSPSIMHALLACHEVSFDCGTTNLTPAGGDPDEPGDSIPGGAFTWKFRRLTITLYSDGVWLADEDAEVGS